PLPLGGLGLFLRHHDEAVTVGELAMHDATALAFDLESHFEPKCLAEPVDRRGGVLIEDGAGKPRPPSRRRFHVYLLARDGVSTAGVVALPARFEQEPDALFRFVDPVFRKAPGRELASLAS